MTVVITEDVKKALDYMVEVVHQQNGAKNAEALRELIRVANIHNYTVDGVCDLLKNAGLRARGNIRDFVEQELKALESV